MKNTWAGACEHLLSYVDSFAGTFEMLFFFAKNRPNGLLSCNSHFHEY